MRRILRVRYQLTSASASPPGPPKRTLGTSSRVHGPGVSPQTARGRPADSNRRRVPSVLSWTTASPNVTGSAPEITRRPDWSLATSTEVSALISAVSSRAKLLARSVAALNVTLILSPRQPRKR